MNPGDPQERLLNPNYSSQSNWVFTAPPSLPIEESATLTFRLPVMPSTRSSTRQRANSNASGSEYHASNTSMDVDDPADMPEDDEDEEDKSKIPVYTTSSRGRKTKKPTTYEESGTEDDRGLEYSDAPDPLNVIDKNDDANGEDDEDADQPTYGLRKRSAKSTSQMNGVVLSDDEGSATVGRYNTRLRSSSKMPQQAINGTSGGRLTRRSAAGAKRSTRRSQPRLSSRRTRSSARLDEQDENYEDEGEPTSSGASASGSAVDEDDDPADLEMGADADAEGEPEEQESDGKPYALRQRTKINYAIPPPLEEMKAPPPKPRSGGRSNGRGFGGRSKAPGWSATGAELSRWMGAGDDSVRPLLYSCALKTDVRTGFRLPSQIIKKEFRSWWCR
jgi:ATPase family AAA domain-containing protein 2